MSFKKICDKHNWPALDAHYCCIKGYREYLADVSLFDVESDTDPFEGEDEDLVEALEELTGDHE